MECISNIPIRSSVGVQTNPPSDDIIPLVLPVCWLALQLSMLNILPHVSLKSDAHVADEQPIARSSKNSTPLSCFKILGKFSYNSVCQLTPRHIRKSSSEKERMRHSDEIKAQVYREMRVL
jgi:hypothetical protein